MSRFLEQYYKNKQENSNTTSTPSGISAQPSKSKFLQNYDQYKPHPPTDFSTKPTPTPSQQNTANAYANRGQQGYNAPVVTPMRTNNNAPTVKDIGNDRKVITNMHGQAYEVFSTPEKDNFGNEIYRSTDGSRYVKNDGSVVNSKNSVPGAGNPFYVNEKKYSDTPTSNPTIADPYRETEAMKTAREISANDFRTKSPLYKYEGIYNKVKNNEPISNEDRALIREAKKVANDNWYNQQGYSGQAKDMYNTFATVEANFGDRVGAILDTANPIKAGMRTVDAVLNIPKGKRFSDNFETTQQQNQQIAKSGLENNPLASFGVDVATTGATLAGQAITAGYLGVPYLRTMGVLSGGEKMLQSQDEGYDYFRSLAEGIGSGAISVATEGIGGIGGGLYKNIAGTTIGKTIASKFGQTAVSNFLKNITTTVNPKILSFLSKLDNSKIGSVIKTGLEEGLEEVIEYPAQIVYENLVLSKDIPIDIKEMAYNGLIGSVLGGAFGGANVAGQIASESANKKTVDKINKVATYLPEEYRPAPIEYNKDITQDEIQSYAQEIVQANQEYVSIIANELEQSQQAPQQSPVNENVQSGVIAPPIETNVNNGNFEPSISNNGIKAYEFNAKEAKINLDDKSNIKTAAYNTFFNKFYNGGLNGTDKTFLQKTSNKIDELFSTDLSDNIYNAGVNDAKANLDSNTSAIQPETQQISTNTYETVQQAFDGKGSAEFIKGISQKVTRIIDKNNPSNTDLRVLYNTSSFANKTARKVFQELTGVKLGNIEASKKAVAAYLNSDSTQQKFSIKANENAEPYSIEMAKTIEEYKSSVDEGLLNFAEYSLSNERDNKANYPISDVNDREVQDIKIATGIDTDGFEHAINVGNIRHINKRHGEKGLHDSSMSDMNDLARVGFVLTNYDKVELLLDENGKPVKSTQFNTKNNEPADVVMYSKRINGTYYVAEAVVDTKARKLQVVSAYIGKNKEGASQVLDAKNPKLTSKTPLANASSTNSISNNSKNVNTLESRLTGDELLDAQDLVAEIKNNGGKVDNNGYVTLFHNTSKKSAEQITESGKMKALEDGIFFSTKADGQISGYGDTVLEFSIPVEKLQLDDVFGDEAHLRIPMQNKNGTVDVSLYLAKKNANNSKKSQTGEQYKQAGSAEWIANKNSETVTKAPENISNIIEKIRVRFDIPVTTGNIKKRNAAGVYVVKPETIRLKMTNDLPTVAHELGHNLDKQYGFSDSPYKGELVRGLSDEMKKNYKPKEYASEGFAEFVRKYLSNIDDAKAEYPKFTEYFTSKLSKQDLKNISELAEEVNAYMSASKLDKFRASNILAKDRKDFKTSKEKLKSGFDRIYQMLADSNHAIKRFSDFVGNNKAIILATNAARIDAVSNSLITRKLADINGKIVSEGMLESIKEVNLNNVQEYADFNTYLEAKHGIERLREGQRIYADDEINNEIEMQKAIAELEALYPHFEKASENLYKFQNEFLKTWCVDTGLISSETAKEWLERWQYYVPLNRYFSPSEYKAMQAGKSGFANQKTPYKQARGSGRDIIPPLESMAINITKVVTAAKKNQVMQEITKQASATDGAGAFLEKVPTPISATAIKTDQLLSTIKNDVKKTLALSGDAEIEFDDAFSVLDDTLNGVILQYGQGKAFGDTVTVMKNGKAEFWQINDPALLESLTYMTPSHAGLFLETYGRVTRFMTSAITGNNLVWSVFSNAPRDIQTYLTYSEDKNPLHLIEGVVSAYTNKALDTMGKTNNIDPLYQMFLSLGGGTGNSVMTANNDYSKSAIKQIQGNTRNTGSRIYGKVLAPMQVIEWASDAIESGPRFAYFKTRVEQGIEPTIAFYEAMDITTNFARSGTLARNINKVIPFFNAGVQGLDKFARWISAQDAPSNIRKAVCKNRTVFWVAISLVGSILTFLLAKQDEENYEQLSTYQKNNAWNFPMGNGEFFSVPKPREIGLLASGFERTLEYAIMGNPKAFQKFDEYIKDMTLPPFISDLAQGNIAGASSSLGVGGTILAVSFNKDFRGNDIVSQAMEQLEPKAQFDNRTTMLAKAIGDAFNASPKKIDYFLNSVLGGYQKINSALLPVGGDAYRDLTLGVKNTYIKDNRYSTDIINNFYENKSKADMMKKTYPQNGDYAIKAKDYTSMAKFYSNYISLAKTEAKTLKNQEARQTVLDMIEQFEKEQENGANRSVKNQLDRFSKTVDSTEFYPATMPAELDVGTGTEKKSYPLTPSEYLEYQTLYLGSYWALVGKALSATKQSNGAAKTIEQMKTSVQRAKNQALEDTKKAMAKKRGIIYFS